MSTIGLASLADHYSDSDEEHVAIEEGEPTLQGKGGSKLNTRTTSPSSSIGHSSVPSDDLRNGKPEAEFNMLPSELDSDEDRRSQAAEIGRARKPDKKRLVSYAPGEGDDEAESDDEDSEEQIDASPESRGKYEEEATAPIDESQLPVWMRGVDFSKPNSFAALLNKVRPAKEEIVLPSLPGGRCAHDLQKKIERFHNAVANGKDFCATIQNKTEYRNPSIYEKLVEFLHINEKGTNFPKHIFDPRGFPKSAYYDELARVQNEIYAKKPVASSQSNTRNSSPVPGQLTSGGVKMSVAGGINQSSSSALKRPASATSLPGMAATSVEESNSRKSKWDSSSSATSAAPPPQSNTSAQILAVGPLKKPKVDI